MQKEAEADYIFDHLYLEYGMGEVVVVHEYWVILYPGCCMRWVVGVG